jgi:hypothetical protein
MRGTGRTSASPQIGAAHYLGAKGVEGVLAGEGFDLTGESLFQVSGMG